MEKKKVLIVDDHPSIRFLLRSLIESHDFTVCGEAADGVAAIEEAKRANPDLILLDLAMPRMNGAEAAPHFEKADAPRGHNPVHDARRFRWQGTGGADGASIG
jgi:two-component system, NarL family, response regulator EvgA